ncbi:MAG: hypothetical protein RIR62_1306, partial [Pseudomonadota bacterium]
DDAPELRLKAAVLGQINALLDARGLTQTAAARLLGLSQPKVSALRNGRLHGFSLERLFALLLRLGCSVDIGLVPATMGRPAGYTLTTDSSRTEIAA